jgi:type VI secretion system secreted protein VgrG
MASAANATATLKQTARLLQVDTPLGPDTFSIRSIHGREAISELFEVNVDLASEDFHIKASSLMAKPLTVRICRGESDQRYINGIVNRVTLVPTQQDALARYRVRILPAIWFLTCTTNCAIFQDKTTPDIIEAIFQKYQLPNYALRLRASYQKRDYCVQYRETAFEFISRLMEEEGICYFFEHTAAGHKLILADCQASHTPCALDPEVSWEPAAGSGFTREEDYISDWNRTIDVRAKKWTQADFQFQKPKFHLLDSEPSVSDVPGPDLERFDYRAALAPWTKANI